jgi:proteic killer suppression protein
MAGDVSRLIPQVAARIRLILATMDNAKSLADIEVLTGFHALTGNRHGTYAVLVTRNWRITFTVFEEETENPETRLLEVHFHIRDVDLEDYH